MSAYFFNDYDRYIGKYITVIYEYGNNYKKMHCKLLEYYKKNLKEKYIILKAYNNIKYHINCDKIIYWIGNYDYTFTDNEDAYKSETSPIESNTCIQNSNSPLKELQYVEIKPSETISPNIQSHDIEISQNKENENIISLETSLNSIDDSTVTYSYSNTIEQYKENNPRKKNSLTSSLATFINYNFQGAYLTIYTTSAEAISGEVIFNFDYLIVLKSDEKTYYINPAQITYFC